MYIVKKLSLIERASYGDVADSVEIVNGGNQFQIIRGYSKSISIGIGVMKVQHAVRAI